MFNFAYFREATAKWLLVFALLMSGSFAHAQLSQRPLLAATSSAKPNLMLLLDNSGSMKARYIPDTFRDRFTTTLAAIDAYRSPDANDLWYDPRIRYTPRPNADGSLQAAGTEANAAAASAAWHDAADTAAWFGGAAVPKPPGIFYDENCTAPPGGGCAFSLGGAYGTPGGTYTDILNFNICTARANGICTAFNSYSVPPPETSNTFVTTTYVVKDSARTDCTTFATRCSWAEERQNVLNWFLYYSTRLAATQTSIGQAFLDPKYNNALRVGYGRMNQLRTVGAGGNSPDPGGLIKRGVRPFTDNPGLGAGFQTERTDFYNWLYAQTAFNGTPSKQLLEAAGQYFLDASNTGPWSAQPIIGDASAHLGCRRNSAVMFSDGAYNGAAPVVPNVDGGIFTGIPNVTHVNPNTGLTFTYQTTPSTTATYVAYPDTIADTMADLAKRYWIQDLRPDLANIVTPVSGNPAFWQHLVFYSIGYGIRGTVNESDIAAYNQNYLRGVASTLAWGDPASGANQIVNDYIHAGYTGRGRSYSVSTAEEVRAAFDDVISRTVEQSGTDAGVAVADSNSSFATLAGELKYVPSYVAVEGSGDVTAYTLTAQGNVASPNSPVWLASRQIPVFNERNLVTMASTGPVSLSTTFASLPTDIRAALGAGADDSFLEYIRGQATGIDSLTNRNFRVRPSLIGTVVNSPPSYIRGTLNMGYGNSTVPGGASYVAYKNNKTNNSLGLLMVPSNDGVLHILNPATGREVMGYIPRAAMPQLKAFATEPYQHRYILDGPVNEGDIYDPVSGSWKSVVYGSGGRGGKFVYALSVPVNSTLTGTLTTPNITKDNLLWEINSTDPQFGNLGHIANPIQSGYLPNGRWVAIFGNGYYSTTGRASLFIVDALTGAFIQEINTNVGTATNPNALTGVTLVRNEGRVIIAAYAGDIRGNMWKFDLRSTVVGGGALGFASGQPLFSIPSGKPITGAPAWRPFRGGTLIVAATGKLIDTTDTSATQTQTIYGVLDKTPFEANEDPARFTAPANMSLLQAQTSTTVVGTSSSVGSFYQVSRNTVDYSTQSGWYLDQSYETGQRSLSDVANFNEAVLVSTVVPPVPSTLEMCVATTGVNAYLYLLDAATGGNADTGGRTRGAQNGFDVNGDGVGDNVSVARAAGFPRNNVIAADRIGPATESVPGGGGGGCNSSSLSGLIVGTGNSSLGIVSTGACPGFLRTWQQLLNPPRIP
jgi:type IV pilus assembly protein PilY1